MSSFGNPNDKMIIDTNSSLSPTTHFNATKVRGYNTVVTYLVGNDTKESSWKNQSIHNLRFYFVSGPNVFGLMNTIVQVAQDQHQYLRL